MSNPLPHIKGFRFAGIAAGIKKSGKPDLALLVSDVPARCAGVFTRNRVVAAPLLVTRPRIESGLCQAVLVNSGNANACTGSQGLADALRCGALAAEVLGLPEELVAVASTGVIGAALPMERFEAGIPRLPAALSEDGAAAAAEAIRTTDAFPKIASGSGVAGGRPYQILALAKGAGMIHPNMATMLAFVCTDACLAPEALEAALRYGVDRSFNIITVDGDTSTNDMVLLLANGMADNPEIKSGSEDAMAFADAVRQVLLELAKMIVRDGEGSSKLVRIVVTGASSDDDALLAARSVATSSLVKTAFFGEDANWGRIIAAVGYSGAQVDPERVEIRFDDIVVVRSGLSTGKELEERATAVLKLPEFTVSIDLGLGSGGAEYYTSDLGYEYVKVNASYRS